MMRLAQVNKA